MKRLLLAMMAVGLGTLSGLWAQAPEPDGAGLERGTLPLTWRTGGPRCMEEPDWQVHEYNANLFIIRESGCVHYEKPFLYLFFGSKNAMLMDTGAGKTDLTALVDGLIAKWAVRNKREKPALIVMHSHGHGDHIARDDQYKTRAGVTFVSADLADVQKFFSIASWPEGQGLIDLGDRPIDIVPIPGHHATAIGLYDRKTGIFFSGDNVYPGRLYVTDWAAFRASTKRMVKFTKGKLVSHVLGCHNEQTSTPYLEYPIGSIYQPAEMTLELSRAHLLELDEALDEAGAAPKRVALRSFTVYPIDAAVRQQMQQMRKMIEEGQRSTMFGQPSKR